MLLKKIPEAMAQKYNVIGYAFNDNVLTVATSDPLNYYGLEDVRLVSGCRISVSLATKADIQIAIERYYSDVDTLNLVDDIDESTLPEVEEDLNLFDANEDDTPVVKLLNSLLIRGYNTSASDIHIEPFEEKLHVRMRIDGMLVDYLDLNKNIQAALIVRIKILSNMDIAEKRLPQDGHFMGVIDGVELNIRVSVIPTIFGEKIVMRYLNSNSTIDRLSTFGMTEENFNKMNHMMSMPHGIIYVTGPTGSVKTTTLYMILEKLAQGQINISTIEDPVERKLNRINQMQVNTMSGLTFDRGLRALMRQDPDVIMVGETRDKETAEISVRAAITGHLVVSTLHTNDAISTIVRLEEMGVEPYMVANSLVGVVAQRLMRKVCPYCKNEVATSLSDRLALQEGINIYLLLPSVFRYSPSRRMTLRTSSGSSVLHSSPAASRARSWLLAIGSACTGANRMRPPDGSSSFAFACSAGASPISRLVTTTRAMRRISCQRCQPSKLSSISLPMARYSTAPGFFLASISSVSTV